MKSSQNKEIGDQYLVPYTTIFTILNGLYQSECESSKIQCDERTEVVIRREMGIKYCAIARVAGKYDRDHTRRTLGWHHLDGGAPGPVRDDFGAAADFFIRLGSAPIAIKVERSYG